MRVLFVAGFGPIVRKGTASQELYMEAFGMALKKEETFGRAFKEKEGGYLYVEDLEGVKHFALWPLSQVADACFGRPSWPRDVVVPQAWIDFDVEDLGNATAELESRGYRLLVSDKKEPWGQMVTRLISPEGLLVGLTVTPWLRADKPSSGPPWRKDAS